MGAIVEIQFHLSRWNRIECPALEYTGPLLTPKFICSKLRFYCSSQPLEFFYESQVRVERKQVDCDLPNLQVELKRDTVLWTAPSSSRVKRILILLGCVKIAYIMLVYVVICLYPNFDESTFSAVAAQWFDAFGLRTATTGTVTRHFATWDAEHYLLLSHDGYTRGVPSCAFYPLWPMAIRAFSLCTLGNHILAGLLFANLLSLGAWVLFYKVVTRRFGDPVASWSVALLIAFPGSLFYQFPYSEALFFALLMVLWFALESKRFGLACTSALLLPLARGVGVFTVLPIAFYWFTECRTVLKQGNRIQNAQGKLEYAHDIPLLFFKMQRMQFRWLALVLAPILGLSLCFVLMWLWTGNPFEGLVAQRYWGVHSIFNLFNIPKFAVSFFQPTIWHGFEGSVLDRCAFVLLVWCLPIINRLGKDMLAWAFALGVLPAMSGTFTSFVRFEALVFPLFVALARFLIQPNRRIWLGWFLALNALLQGILLVRFINFRWAG